MASSEKIYLSQDYEKWRKAPSPHFGNEHSSPSGNSYDPDRARSYGNDEQQVVVPSHTTRRRLMTKIDLRLIPCLSILYLFAFLDRTNIANAAIFGLEEDLGITPGSTQYNTALTIFFVPYILFEIPSNILLKKLKPHVWLSICMFGFGLVTVCQGLVQNYSGLLATRFFLGLTETGMFPGMTELLAHKGCFYLIGMWYKRDEAQKRFSFFFSSTTLAGAFGGLLASAIGKMDGMRGFRGWRWIFILEGVLTCVVAIFFWFLLPDFPEDAKWLREDERAYVHARLEVDQGKSALERDITLKDVVHVFKDYKIIVGGFMYFGLIVPAYGYAYFAPSIIRTYGYSPIQTQLYSVPPWVAAFGFSMLVAWASDRLRHRFLFTLIPIAIGIAGFAMLLAGSNNRNVKYAALFLVTCGCYSAMPIIVCWFNLNISTHLRRSVGSAWQIGFGNIGGIIATFAFLQKDAPLYKPGYGICIGFICLSVASCVVYFFAVWSQNKHRAKSIPVETTESERTKLGDMAMTYRYQL